MNLLRGKEDGNLHDSEAVVALEQWTIRVPTSALSDTFRVQKLR